MYFKDKVVWITGASSGIGEALAYALSKEGAQLILSARRISVLEEVQRKCAFPDKITLIPLDLTEESSIFAKAKEVLRKHQRIDILINNGGVSQRSLIVETEMKVYRQLMEVNYFGTIALSKALLPQFVAQQSGHIVVISSLMGKFSSPLRSGYAAAKHALHGFFDGLRAEHYKDKIYVTMICPGFIQTNVSLNSLRGSGEKHAKMDSKTAEGIPVEQCAQRILRAIRKQKEEVYIAQKERLAIYMKRFFPTILSRLLRKIPVS